MSQSAVLRTEEEESLSGDRCRNRSNVPARVRQQSAGSNFWLKGWTRLTPGSTPAGIGPSLGFCAHSESSHGPLANWLYLSEQRSHSWKALGFEGERPPGWLLPPTSQVPGMPPLQHLQLVLPSGSSWDTGLPAPWQAQLSLQGWGSLTPPLSTWPTALPVWCHALNNSFGVSSVLFLKAISPP